MVDSSDAEKLQGETGRRSPTRVAMGSGGGGGEDAERVQESIGGVIEDICHDINISLDYFENQYDKKVEEIFITGGASNTPGLPETLERTVQKPVNRWNPIQHFELDLSKESAQELQDHASQAAIALGLAARITG
jgi:type IV pilus assembly protein PilM